MLRNRFRLSVGGCLPRPPIDVGGGITGCDVGGKQAAVCVHVDTQGGSFRGDEAYFDC